MAAVNTGVFTMSGNGVFKVGSFARYAVATSSAFTGLGLTCDAWLLFRYHWLPTHLIIVRSTSKDLICSHICNTQRRALDIYDSYFFFSLSARLPVLCMVISTLALTTFLALVAYDAWPKGVLVTFFMWGMVMTLQFLVYGVHWVAKGVVGVVRMVRRGIGMVVNGARKHHGMEDGAGRRKGKDVCSG